MRMSLRELETSVRATLACARWQEFAPLSDTRHNLQFGNGRCSGHAKPQFNYCTRANWLAGGAVTRNAVQIDLGGPQFSALGPSIGIRLLYWNHKADRWYFWNSSERHARQFSDVILWRWTAALIIEDIDEKWQIKKTFEKIIYA